MTRLLRSDQPRQPRSSRPVLGQCDALLLHEGDDGDGVPSEAGEEEERHCDAPATHRVHTDYLLCEEHFRMPQGRTLGRPRRQRRSAGEDANAAAES